jgi:sulfoquinovose isomerase
VKPWTALPSHRAWLDGECRRLLGFGAALAHRGGGSAWLGADGSPDVEAGVHTWITARMVHVYVLGQLLGVPGAQPLAEASLPGLLGPLRDSRHGGWHPSLSAAGEPAPGKSCYDHAFVVLAGASASVAGLEGAPALLDEALATLDARFWDDAAGLCVDTWDTAWTSLDGYRGLNANMHAVEALLAASDATGDLEWRDRALRIATSVVGWAEPRDWRIPEHFDSDWQPRLEFNVDLPADRFKPYGATIGHGLEWSRLLLHLEAALGAAAPDFLAPAAASLFARAVADGWAVDGADGFVYTTSWTGEPVVRDRFHWVVAEGISAASALHRRTGEAIYADWYARWWDFAATYLLDLTGGSWHHQLDERNRPAATVWRGKPDLYHNVQATLIPRLPLAPGLAVALAGGLLDA